MTIKMPHQLFINGEFVDADGGKTYKTINPTDGMVRMERRDKDKMDTTNIDVTPRVECCFSVLALWFDILMYLNLFVPQAICDVSLAQISDVDKAVAAAKEAFKEGEWGKMNPRDRGRLIYQLVQLFSLN